jgi:hypothetical protein
MQLLLCHSKVASHFHKFLRLISELSSFPEGIFKPVLGSIGCSGIIDGLADE